MASTGFGFGVEFTDVDDTTRQTLEAYIRQAVGES